MSTTHPTVMARMIFPNLCVKDLPRSIAFWTELGFSFNAQFTGEQAACMVINDLASVMLLTEPFFRGFTSRQPCDTATHTEVFLALQLESREAVTAMVEKAMALGATPVQGPVDHGFMFQWSFYDLDGHHWEPFHMDPAHVQG